MAKFVRESLLRNLVVEQYNVDRCFTELRAGDVQSRGDLVASSAKYVAFVTPQNGSSGVRAVDIQATGKQGAITNKSEQSCQQGSVYDLQFSPHNPSILASGSGRGSVAIWTVRGTMQDVELECSQKIECESRVQSIQWNPSASGIAAVLAGDSALLIDAESGSAIRSIGVGAQTMDASWNVTGNWFLSLNEDKSIRQVDPRAGNDTIALVENAHQGARALGRITSAGVSAHGELDNFFYSTGFSLTRDREFAVWDVRNLSKGAVARQKVTAGGTGIIYPLVVPDTKILLLVARGESSVRAYEPTREEPFVFPVSHSNTSAQPFLSACLAPVVACDYMSCEVSRLFKLTTTSVDAVRIEIPRRLKLTFHEDLFPPTADVLNAALSAKEWKQGATATQPCVPYRELVNRVTGQEASESSEAQNEEQEEQEKQQDEPEETTFEPSEMDKRMSKMMGYIPKFKYARSTAVKKDDTVFNMKVGPNPCLAISTTHYAVPWQGGGGPVYVSSLSKVGKVEAPEQEPVLNGHSKPVFCLEFNPFDDKVLVSGSDDCYIRTWRLDLDGDITDSSSSELAGHQSSVRLLKFHPSAGGLLASASQDATVRLWDVNESKAISTLVQSTEMFTSMDWNYNGSVLAAVNRANEMSLVDPRTGAPVGVCEKTHQGAKPSYLSWMGNSPYVLTSGCARMGFREFAVWDSRKLSDALHTAKVDTGATSFEPLYVEDNGVVIFIARGENTFHIYEIEDLTHTTVKPDFAGENPLKPHKCNTYIAPGETTSAVALMPRRVLDMSKTEFARVYRLSPTVLEPVSFSIPRAADLSEYFADDIYADTRAGQVAIGIDPWLAGTDADPVLESLNRSKKRNLSERDPALAHASLKRAQANTLRFRKQKEEEDERARREAEAFQRMQQLAIQHEEYNPNLSTGRHGHDQARKAGLESEQQQQELESEVADDEWDD